MAGLVEERGTAMNGGSHREPFHHQPTYPGSLSHMSMYRAVLPGIHQGLHPIVSSLQLGNGYADYFKVPYPFLVQNAAPYNPARYSTGTTSLAQNPPAQPPLLPLPSSPHATKELQKLPADLAMMMGYNIRA